MCNSAPLTEVYALNFQRPCYLIRRATCQLHMARGATEAMNDKCEMMNERQTACASHSSLIISHSSFSLCQSVQRRANLDVSRAFLVIGIDAHPRHTAVFVDEIDGRLWDALKRDIAVRLAVVLMLADAVGVDHLMPDV